MTVNVDEKETLVNEACNMLMKIISDTDPKTVRNILYLALEGYQFQKTTTEVTIYEGNQNEKLIRAFLVSKRVNGCTENTIKVYNNYLSNVLKIINKPADQINANDFRIYFAKRELNDHVSARSRDNERRVLSSFYTWMVDEELILKNPIRKIPFIKGVKTKKKAFTDAELEEIRLAVTTQKENAILELLISTGCRVSEICQIMVSDIAENKVLVHGKGQKDRYVYLTARAKKAIELYMETEYFKKRYSLGNPYLFARERMIEPDRYMHMDKGAVENMVRTLGKKADVKNVHPHRFRRTCATNALRRGMPIEQVSKMLGHNSIETTQIYLDLDEESLENAHKKYVV